MYLSYSKVNKEEYLNSYFEMCFFKKEFMILIFIFQGEDLTIELRQHDDYVSGMFYLGEV
jgi:hypothetical protein